VAWHQTQHSLTYAVLLLQFTVLQDHEQALERERAAAASRLREACERYEGQMQTARMRLMADTGEQRWRCLGIHNRRLCHGDGHPCWQISTCCAVHTVNCAAGKMHFSHKVSHLLPAMYDVAAAFYLLPLLVLIASKNATHTSGLLNCTVHSHLTNNEAGGCC
jgi:hypothetical protein